MVLQMIFKKVPTSVHAAGLRNYKDGIEREIAPGPVFSRGPGINISMKKRGNKEACIIVTSDTYNFYPGLVFPHNLLRP